jgi:hypothetical protein
MPLASGRPKRSHGKQVKRFFTVVNRYFPDFAKHGFFRGLIEVG